MTDRELEERLRAWYRTQVGEHETAPLSLRRDVAAIPRTSSGRARWFGRGRGRGVILFAAAALLLVGGAVAAGSGLLRLPSLVPPEPLPSLAAVATPSPAVSPSPAATPRPAAVIAYIRYVYRTYQMTPTPRVWIVGTDGSGAHELFPGGTDGETEVAWSPDGTRLVYAEAGTEGGRLVLTDSNGSVPQALDPGCIAPDCWDLSAAFSPDGTQLVLARVHGATATHSTIATMDLATGRVVELHSTAIGISERPRWSADGKQIVFSSVEPFGDGSAVFIVDADGTNLHQLSAASLPARGPDWSPDGSRIVFTSNVVNIVRVDGKNVDDVQQDVYTVRPDWTDLRRLTTDGFSGGATWTPDGRIMFTRACAVQRPTGSSTTGPDCRASGLWTMDADGSNARLVVPAGNGIDGPLVGMFYAAFEAAWQPRP